MKLCRKEGITIVSTLFWCLAVRVILGGDSHWGVAFLACFRGRFVHIIFLIRISNQINHSKLPYKNPTYLCPYIVYFFYLRANIKKR